MDINELLVLTITRKASDLHLVAGYVPTLRINGSLHFMVTFPEISAGEIEKMVFSLLSPSQKEKLVGNRELDFSTAYKDKNGEITRFRVNAYYQQNTLAVSFRLIPAHVPTIDELHLPSVIHEFAKLKQGFVLLTGPSGQGKSTTLSSIISEINTTRMLNIVTIEDPIEYVYEKGKSLISQREVEHDTLSFARALKSILREDPDVVYIGEMRDLESMTAALTIAETGHLVFSTLHTNNASQTIDRIIDIFPPASRDQIRMQLASVVAGIVAQRLLPASSGGRVPVCEILLGTSGVKNTIREGKTFLLDNIIQTSEDVGMILFEKHLKMLVEQNIVSPEVAIENALRPDVYEQLMGGR